MAHVGAIVPGKAILESQVVHDDLRPLLRLGMGHRKGQGLFVTGRGAAPWTAV